MENEPNPKRAFIEKTERFIVESGKSVGKYVVGKIVTSAIIGILAFIIFKILGIDMAWLMALILAVTNLVPMIGPWIGLIVCAVIIVFFEPIFALYTSLTALLLQLLEQFVLLPLVVGKAVDLKPMLIICVLIIGSLAFGFWGVVLAIPIAAVLKIGYNIFIAKKDNS
ncbi:MAG: AI-2E family transporter [Clostridia bacterium]|nr:AI-2E family transporter [Clostridia bacterium]MBN2883710.1 AI-2E family transporter [Clostridia bacterium]